MALHVRCCRRSYEGTTKGVSTIGGRWQFGEHGRIGALDYYGYDTFNTFYGAASGFVRLGGERGIELQGAAQYTNQRSAGDALAGKFSTQQFGAKLDIGPQSQTLTLAYTQTGSELRHPQTLGRHAELQQRYRSGLRPGGGTRLAHRSRL